VLNSILFAFFVLGIFIGTGTGFLIFQFDKSWKKITTFGIDGGIVASFFAVYNIFNFPPESRIASFSIFLIMLLSSTIAIVMVLASNLKKNSAPVLRFSLTDILIGSNKSLEQYYDLKKKMIETELNLPILEQKKKEIDYKESEIIKKEKQLLEDKRKADVTIKKAIHIHLPVNSLLPIDARFIDNIPKYVNDYIFFSKIISATVQQYEELRRKEKTYSQLDLLYGYFFQLCTSIACHLFNSNNDVRVHVRYLKANNYEKLVSSIGSVEYSKTLTPICSTSGMIYTAGKQKRSLIKSLNPTCHDKADNDHVWEDYMTLVFDNFYDRDIPFLSMGISVKSQSNYRELFAFLNYCKFEQLVQDEINKFDNIINIKETLYPVAVAV